MINVKMQKGVRLAVMMFLLAGINSLATGAGLESITLDDARNLIFELWGEVDRLKTENASLGDALEVLRDQLSEKEQSLTAEIAQKQAELSKIQETNESLALTISEMKAAQEAQAGEFEQIQQQLGVTQAAQANEARQRQALEARARELIAQQHALQMGSLTGGEQYAREGLERGALEHLQNINQIAQEQIGQQRAREERLRRFGAEIQAGRQRLQQIQQEQPQAAQGRVGRVGVMAR